jgi:excinuclease ABC subunit B
MDFKVVSDYSPSGDQPAAIHALVESIRSGARAQTLLGVTGSGKTYTVAHVVAQLQIPTLIISHNKTLAAQLYSEFRSFFPNNAVEYFVSYYDYYQPEAYIPQTDTYIAKDASINEEIEKLRLSTMSSLTTRRDVIVVASVSCIYGSGSPEDFNAMVCALQVGAEIERDAVLSRLVDLQYSRNDAARVRGTFRARGDVVEIFPSHQDDGLRVDFSGDQVESITRFDPLTGDAIETLQYAHVFPAKQFVTPYPKIEQALGAIRQELDERIAWFEGRGKLLEAQRLKMRTEYDLEMLQELGFCPGIENYSRHLSGRNPGEPPATLMDFFPEDYLLVIDESHVTVSQVQGMYHGDRSRKETLVEHGFRLPSALDNRPLNFVEFEQRYRRVVYTSATPGDFERERSTRVVEQIVRPTGLLDPRVTVRPLAGQIDDLIEETRRRAERGERVLVTTLTKRTSEDLADYLREIGIRVRYIHSEIDAIERVEILRALREAEFDCLVGINLLREGLDLPEVSLVAILDADKEGFLRSETSLIQTAGRAARHVNGEVILYADEMTESIRRLLEVTESRRARQIEYNRAHGIVPRSARRGKQASLAEIAGRGSARDDPNRRVAEAAGEEADATELIYELEREMVEAASRLEFEHAALLRDRVRELKRMAGMDEETPLAGAKPESARRGRRGAKRAARGSKRKKVSRK